MRKRLRLGEHVTRNCERHARRVHAKWDAENAGAAGRGWRGAVVNGNTRYACQTMERSQGLTAARLATPLLRQQSCTSTAWMAHRAARNRRRRSRRFTGECAFTFSCWLMIDDGGRALAG